MKQKQIAAIALSLYSMTCQAQSGATGGGDQCKNEINQHRLEIKAWIERDEAREIDFSVAKIKDISYDFTPGKIAYRKAMLEALAEGRVAINCYLDPSRIQDPKAQQIARTQGVSYREVKVRGENTTCINYEDANGKSHIDCNYDLVMNENSLGNPNYINTHHEFASIAGIELRTSAPSDMSVSTQLSRFEHKVSVKKLGPKQAMPESQAAKHQQNQIPVRIDGLQDKDYQTTHGRNTRPIKRARKLIKEIERNPELLEIANQCEQDVALNFEIERAGFYESKDIYGQHYIAAQRPMVTLVSYGTTLSRVTATDDSLAALLTAAKSVLTAACSTLHQPAQLIDLEFRTSATLDHSLIAHTLDSSESLQKFRARHSCKPKLVLKDEVNRVSQYCDLNGQNCYLETVLLLQLTCGKISKEGLSSQSIARISSTVAELLESADFKDQ